jgi:hypothetical protein
VGPTERARCAGIANGSTLFASDTRLGDVAAPATVVRLAQTSAIKQPNAAPKPLNDLAVDITDRRFPSVGNATVYEPD